MGGSTLTPPAKTASTLLRLFGAVGEEGGGMTLLPPALFPSASVSASVSASAASIRSGGQRVRKQASERASGRGGVYNTERERSRSRACRAYGSRGRKNRSSRRRSWRSSGQSSSGRWWACPGRRGGSARHNLASCMNRKAFGHDSLT